MACSDHQHSYCDYLGQYQAPNGIDPNQGISYGPASSPEYIIKPENSTLPPVQGRLRGALKGDNSTKKTVSFKPTCTVRITHVCEDSTADDKSRLYYSRHELDMMKLEANALCILSRALPVAAASAGTHLLDRRDSILTRTRAVATDTPRGLELTMYPARKRIKLIAMQSLLRYQVLLDTKPNLGSDDRQLALAGASTRLTAWSTLVAMETARWDALRAYDSDGYPIPVVSEPVIITSPFPFYMKRRITPDDEAGAKRRKIDRVV